MTTPEPMTARTQYVVRELWTLAWAASVQRARMYKTGTNPDSRAVKTFRREIATYMEDEILPMYKESCDPGQHYKNIDALAALANRAGAGLLSGDGYKYGIAQKLLNLALKYHWCIGLVGEPPHCPVDRIIIERTRFRGKLNWTEIKYQGQYRDVIDEIDRLARVEGLSIAAWELKHYARR